MLRCHNPEVNVDQLKKDRKYTMAAPLMGVATSKITRKLTV
jgi:hypothetical protein